MNIFFLHKTPRLCAKFLSDKHIPKMVLETTQMLCTAYQKHYKERVSELYKPAYPNHPMTIWVGSRLNNYEWTMDLLKELLKEYTKRFKKVHKCTEIYNILKIRGLNMSIIDYLQSVKFSEPPQCMPDQFQQKNYVKAYRQYYKIGKAHLHNYNRAKMPRFLK